MSEKLTREQALERNAAIDAVMQEVEPVWEAALEARNKAQEALDSITQLRLRVQQMQLANVKAASGEN